MAQLFSTDDTLLQARIGLRIAELRLLAAWTACRFARMQEVEHGRLGSMPLIAMQKQAGGRKFYAIPPRH